LSALSERHAVLFGKASSCENPILIRLNDRDKFLQAFRAETPPPPLPQDVAQDKAVERVALAAVPDKATGDGIPF
jgi:hypothetical protein